MEIIKATGLTKTYRNNRGIKDLNISIEAGTVFGLLGPNGSGKTTTMKVMTGLLYATEGTLTVFGKDPMVDAPAIMARTCCMIETPGLYNYLTAKKNIKMLARMFPDAKSGRDDEVLKQMGIYEYRNEKVSQFSLGMKQRLAFAMALYAEAELLILDEPTNGMDISGVAHIREILKNQQEQGKTILISSHLAHEIEQICTHLCVLNEGVLIDTAKVSEITNRHGSVENYYLATIKQFENGGAAL